ncbi:MAG: tripartite tricarboxylate transporter substrate binding protein [Betaproteobacteria bacterium]|nr:tripartite tricarboxylate transporter substrate binding protein [Betaproteobacteria bacterium]
MKTDQKKFRRVRAAHAQTHVTHLTRARCAPYVSVVLALGALTVLPAATQAQSYPAKPIRMIVPFPAGGGVDYVGRIVGKGMSDRLGQQVLIDNRAGASAIIGMEATKNAPPDGYTIAATSNGPLAINPHIFKKLPYDSLRDYTHVAMISTFPYILVAHPSLPVKNVKELIALARARPGELAYSSPGTGNGQHLATALFASMAKLDMLHIPYKGNAPSVISLVSGETQLTFSSIPGMLPHVRAGRVRGLAVSTAQRMPSLPDTPTVAESGVAGFEAFGWGGMIAPANLPRDIVNALNKAIVDTLKQPDTAQRMITDGALPSPGSPEELTAYLKTELAKWGRVVKLANVRPE